YLLLSFLSFLTPDPTSLPYLLSFSTRRSSDLFYPLFQLGGNEQICQILHIVQHLAGFHKPIIQIIFRSLRCVLYLPAFQKMQIIAQYPQAAHFLLPVCFQQGTFRFGQGDCRWWLVRVNPEVMSQLFSRLVVAQIKQPRHKVNHITGYSAAGAVKIPFVQLHAGVPVIVKGTASHTVSIDLQPIISRRRWDTKSYIY